MSRLNCADFMFVAEEDATYLIDGADGINEFQLIKFSNVPPGETRHIVCSKQVSDETIHKLNRAITFE